MKSRFQRPLPLAALVLALAWIHAGVADAAVVYSDHFKVLAPRSQTELTDRYDLDVNADGVPDVRFDYAAFGQFGPSQGMVTGLNGTAIAAPDMPGPFTEHVNHFGRGHTVGPDVAFSPAGTPWPLEREFLTGHNLIWGAAQGPHFMGLRFPLSDGDHYAWVRISHDQWLLTEPNPDAPGPLIIYSMAYETAPDTPITIPEPTTVAALACVVFVTFVTRIRPRAGASFRKHLGRGGAPI